VEYLNMPANIASIDGADSIAYIDYTPWHKMGRNILKELQAAEPSERLGIALRAGKLDWDVELQPVADMRGNVIPGHMVNMRVAADGSYIPLGLVGSGFQNFKNAAIMDVAEPLVTQFGAVPAAIGSLGSGEVCWLLLRLADATLTPLPGDDVRGYALMRWGHDGNLALNILGTSIRVICQNTMNMATAGRKSWITVRHSGNAAAKLDQAARIMAQLMAAMQTTGETFASMGAKNLSAREIVEFIDKVIPNTDAAKATVAPVIAARRETIARLVHAGRGAAMANQRVDTRNGDASLWAVVNAVSEYMDHVRPAEAASEAGLQRAAQSAIFGENAQIKSAALELARELVAA
jgi:phage/plasmid-like protein (TIGR03299 family)